MHRQSLGSSPSPKHVEHPSSETQKLSSPPSSSGSGTEEDEEEVKKKSMRPKHTHAMPIAPESYIHLIPMLTLICFLILYLSSHRPSPIDLAEFNVPNAFSDPSELQGITKGDTMAVRSLKNLDHEQSGRAKHRMLHRKIAHF